jgi:hypothetical protein
VTEHENAAMSPQQRALLNKRKHEMYAKKNDKKKFAKMLEMTPKEIAQSTGMIIQLISLQQKYRDAVGYLLSINV